MFSHIMIGADDLDRSRRFYDAILGALGIAAGQHDGAGHIIYRAGGNIFALTTPLNGQPATSANGGTIGFLAEGPQAINAWHEAGTSAGGTSCEDPPGVRAIAGHKVYLAYLRDPAGNKLCAYHRLLC
ncbi:hypothetical protein ACFB49_25810 [Sphingomonas sp. DBB INV C78]|uniref:VOC family protein n=1 Tax=Sphingomonas sp. DBB INV C78 TaxID=3349434 RepID=UPI0036D3A6D4